MIFSLCRGRNKFGGFLKASHVLSGLGSQALGSRFHVLSSTNIMFQNNEDYTNHKLVITPSLIEVNR